MKTKKSIIQWVSSILLLDFIFWIFVGISCVKDAVSCSETAMFGAYFFYLPWSLIPQPWISPQFLPILFLVFLHVLLGVLLGYIFRKKRFKRAMSIAISFVLVIGLAFAVGYIEHQKELTSSTMTKLIGVTTIDDGFLNYVDVEWAEGGPNGFHINIDKSSVTGENIANFKNTEVTLLKQPDMSPETISFDKYLEARHECKATPETCLYYGVGADYEYFDATFNDAGFISLVEKYVP